MVWLTKHSAHASSHASLHVAIIMDGNGRWAKARGLPRHLGHKKGLEVIQQVVKACKNLKIQYLTLYAFSAENWNRSAEEVDYLMGLLRYYLQHELKKLHKEGVCLRVIGDRTNLATDIIDSIKEAEDTTRHNHGIYLNVALSYGSRQEILRAVHDIATCVKEKTLDLESITEEVFSQYLYTHDIPEPDLLIRTGAEKRLSNFLLWQLAYTELLFLDILWPDFTASDLIRAMDEFKMRERRYGA